MSDGPTDPAADNYDVTANEYQHPLRDVIQLGQTQHGPDADYYDTISQESGVYDTIEQETGLYDTIGQETDPYDTTGPGVQQEPHQYDAIQLDQNQGPRETDTDAADYLEPIDYTYYLTPINEQIGLAHNTTGEKVA